MQLGDDRGQLAPPLEFIIAVVALGEAAQMRNERIAIREPIGPDAVYDTGSHDLLGAPSADAEQEFDGRPVDERAGERFDLPDHAVDLAVPGRFCGHGCFPMLVRTCAKYKPG
jgi:hypothetical protein